MSLDINAIADTEETTGYEQGRFYPLGKTEKYFRYEAFQGSNQTKTMQYNVSPKKNKGFVTFKFYRSISESFMKDWKINRMTGMSVIWQYSDMEGNKLEIPAKHIWAA